MAVHYLTLRVYDARTAKWTGLLDNSSRTVVLDSYVEKRVRTMFGNNWTFVDDQISWRYGVVAHANLGSVRQWELLN